LSKAILVADRTEVDPAVARKIAENEARFREVNERIQASARRWDAQDEVSLPFVCECGRPQCVEILRLGSDEYARARTNGRYFICSPGHQITEGGIGRVVEEHAKFVIMEKIGVAGAVAEQLDHHEPDEDIEQAS
jgi:hypothetical protein